MVSGYRLGFRVAGFWSEVLCLRDLKNLFKLAAIGPLLPRPLRQAAPGGVA